MFIPPPPATVNDIPPRPVPPNPTGSKYLRSINPADGVGQSIRVDVYSVLAAFNVACPARAHAIKKLLCAGLRGKGDSLQDLRETVDAVNRAIALEGDRVREKPIEPGGEAAARSVEIWVDQTPRPPAPPSHPQPPRRIPEPMLSPRHYD